MKKSILILSVAGLALFSCKKEQKENVKNTNDFVNQEKDNNYRVPMGNSTVTITGKVDSSYSKYAGTTYSFENKSFSFVNDNVDSDNEMSTKSTIYYNESEVKKTYTTKSVWISMYETNGFDEDDVKNSNYISISFDIFEGTLTTSQIEEGYTTGAPQNIRIQSNYEYQPEKTIDVVSNYESISKTNAKKKFDNDLGKIVVETKKIENVTITSFSFDETTGKISFEFSGIDPDSKFSAKGKVETTILRNYIQETEDNTKMNF